MATNLDPNEENAAILWAEIHALRNAIKGPEGYATWRDAAVAERVRRVRAEAEKVPEPVQQAVAWVEPEMLKHGGDFMAHGHHPRFTLPLYLAAGRADAQPAEADALTIAWMDGRHQGRKAAEAEKLDAERWQWFRSWWMNDDAPCAGFIHAETEEQLDAAVDAARAEKGGA